MQEAGERIEPSTPIPDPPDASERIERVRTQLEELDAQARHFMQERPLVTAAAALVLGYAIGRLTLRR